VSNRTTCYNLPGLCSIMAEHSRRPVVVTLYLGYWGSAVCMNWPSVSNTAGGPTLATPIGFCAGCFHAAVEGWGTCTLTVWSTKPTRFTIRSFRNLLSLGVPTLSTWSVSKENQGKPMAKQGQAVIPVTALVACHLFSGSQVEYSNLVVILR
jgi:hypothetical protein